MTFSSIIGICGRASSGKDSTARHLSEHHGYKHLSLAEPIKHLVGEVFGFSHEQLWGSSSKREQIITIDWDVALDKLHLLGYDWLEEVNGSFKFPELEMAFYHLKNHYYDTLSVRVAAQYIGTDFGRHVLGEDVWVNYLLNRANQYIGYGYKGVVVSDVRFLNEVEAIRKHNGKVIKLLRNANIPITGIPNHASEAEQSEIPTELFSCILKNQSTLQDLYDSVDLFLQCGCCV